MIWRMWICVVLCSSASLFASEKVSGTKLSREILSKSLELGQEFLLKNQKAAGNFNYQYDFRKGQDDGFDSVVRQAGALWGLVLTHEALPSAKSKEAICKGIAFFRKHSTFLPDGRAILEYPHSPRRTGAMALVGLALVDFLRVEEDLPPDNIQQYRNMLDSYLKTLLALQVSGRGFYSAFDAQGYGTSRPSSYFDGETLLLLAKAAKYGFRPKLKERVMELANTMYGIHVSDALQLDPDSPDTKGFYQWGTMAFFEIYTSGWKGSQVYAQRIIDMANWMIDVHHVLTRVRNTAYAFEGITHAYEVARLRGDDKATNKFGQAIEQGLSKLTSWQVGGPIPNSYLQQQENVPEISIGGILNEREAPLLRIDVTQHQAHAVMLALQYVYKQ